MVSTRRSSRRCRVQSDESTAALADGTAWISKYSGQRTGPKLSALNLPGTLRAFGCAASPRRHRSVAEQGARSTRRQYAAQAPQPVRKAAVESVRRRGRGLAARRMRVRSRVPDDVISTTKQRLMYACNTLSTSDRSKAHDRRSGAKNRARGTRDGGALNVITG